MKIRCKQCGAKFKNPATCGYCTHNNCPVQELRGGTRRLETKLQQQLLSFTNLKEHKHKDVTFIAQMETPEIEDTPPYFDDNQDSYSWVRL